MKIQFLAAMVVASVLVSACGEKHEKVHAVDKVTEAQETAIKKTPQAEEIIFDDHGKPTFAETSGASAADSVTEATKETASPATDSAVDANKATTKRQ